MALATATILGGLAATALAGGIASEVQKKQLADTDRANAAASAINAAAKAQKESKTLRNAETQRKSLLKKRTETIQTSPLGLSGSFDTTKKKTLLGQ